MADARIEKLLEEAAAVYCFYHRCLLYSNDAPPPQLYKYSDFLDALNAYRGALENSATKDATTVRVYNDFSWEINLLYDTAVEIVSQRFSNVFNTYEERRDAYEYWRNRLPWFFVPVTDRAKDLTRNSAERVVAENSAVLASLRKGLDLSRKSNTACEYYKNEWTAVRHSMLVFMEEMSFLSKRVDDFNGYFNDKRNVTVAVLGNMVSSVGVLIAVAGLIIAILTSRWFDTAPNKTAPASDLTILYHDVGGLVQNVAEMRRTIDAQAAKNETIIQAFGGLNQNLAEMQKALAAQGVKNESFSKDTLLALDRLKDQIFTGEGAMRDRADAIFNDTCSHLRSERDALGNKIIDV